MRSRKRRSADAAVRYKRGNRPLPVFKLQGSWSQRYWAKNRLIWSFNDQRTSKSDKVTTPKRQNSSEIVFDFRWDLKKREAGHFKTGPRFGERSSERKRAANPASGAWGSNSCIANNYPNEDDSGLGQKKSKNSMDSAISYTILMRMTSSSRQTAVPRGRSSSSAFLKLKAFKLKVSVNIQTKTPLASLC